MKLIEMKHFCCRIIRHHTPVLVCEERREVERRDRGGEG